MNLQELKRMLKQKETEYEKRSADGGDVKELREIVDEMKELREHIDLVAEAEELQRRALPSQEGLAPETRRNTDDTKEVRELSAEEVDTEYEKTFLRAFRGNKLSERDIELYNRMVELRDVPNATPYMQSNVDEDGGFIVPHSVSTMIEEYKRQQEFDLTNLVDVQTTSVLSGEFTYEKLANITPFQNVSEWDTIPEVGTPQFERKSYEIQDYAGILPLPRKLLQDTDQNLLNHIAKFIARKTVVTRNLAIMEVINATYTDKKAIVDADDILDVFDLELDQAFNAGAIIVTNQVGYNYLRKMKNSNGENLMQPDIAQPTKRAIDGHRVEVLPNRTLPSAGDLAPVFIGEFREAVRFFDRGVYEITPTTIGGDAFKRNSYDIRVIDRFDVIALDDAAVVAGEIDVTAPVGDDTP